jgi:hypothetical protein
MASMAIIQTKVINELVSILKSNPAVFEKEKNARENNIE